MPREFVSHLFPPRSTHTRRLDVFHAPVISTEALIKLKSEEASPNFNLHLDKPSFRDATHHLFSANGNERVAVIADVDGTIKETRDLFRPGNILLSQLVHLKKLSNLPNVSLLAVTDGPQKGYQNSRFWSDNGKWYWYVPQCFRQLNVEFKGAKVTKGFIYGGLKHTEYGVNIAVDFVTAAAQSNELNRVLVIGDRATDMIYAIDICNVLYDTGRFRGTFDGYWVGKHNS